MKRIAYFSCRGISKSVAGNVGPEDSGFTYNSDGDEEAVTRYGMANEMDLWHLWCHTEFELVTVMSSIHRQDMHEPVY